MTGEAIAALRMMSFFRRCTVLGAELRELLDALAQVTQERDAALAIIAGRTVAPTEAEAAAHNATGGWWLLSRGAGTRAVVEAFAGAGDVGEYVGWCAGRSRPVLTWRALDADHAPCAWPTGGAP